MAPATNGCYGSKARAEKPHTHVRYAFWKPGARELPTSLHQRVLGVMLESYAHMECNLGTVQTIELLRCVPVH